jgi:hypothetical protein
MALVGVVVVAALLLGRLLGGRPARLARVPLVGWALTIGAAAARLGGSAIARSTGSAAPYVAGSVIATLLVVTFLVRNRTLHGIPLVALGLGLNALVVGLNGAMPVRARAAVEAGVGLHNIAAGLDPRHVVSGPDTVLAALGDRIPVPLPVLPEVLSVGDVLIAAGIGLLVVMAMTSGARYDAGLDHRHSTERDLVDSR